MTLARVSRRCVAHLRLQGTLRSRKQRPPWAKRRVDRHDLSMPEYADVVEDVIEALVHGEAGSSVDDLEVQRRDDGTILADFGDPAHYFVVSVRKVARGS